MDRVERKITALKAQGKNPQRINVFLDGEFSFGLSRRVAAWLQVGQILTEAQIEQLLQEDRLESLYQRCLHYLSYRPRSEQEMHRYLMGYEQDETVRAQVIERLKSNGWVDDQRFAEQWVENRVVFRPRSKKALVLELRQHGIQPTVVEQAVQDLDEAEMAYQAVQKVLHRYRDSERLTFRRKLQDYLARRGFSYEVILPTILRCWQEIHQEIDQGQEEE